jgi:hypothetical protein
MTEHYEKGCIINPGVELEDERHDPPVVMFRGLFIEEEAGRPFASKEAQGRAGASQGFAFDVRAIDFAELLEVFGVHAVRSTEHMEIEAIRAEPPLGVATPILGFRNPQTGKEWRPAKLVTLKAPPPEELRLDEMRQRLPPLELCPHGTRKALDFCPVCDGAAAEPSEAERLYLAHSAAVIQGHGLDPERAMIPWENRADQRFWQKLVEVLPACGYRRSDGSSKQWSSETPQPLEKLEKLEKAGLLKQVGGSWEGFCRRATEESEAAEACTVVPMAEVPEGLDSAIKERAQCFFIVRRRMAEAMLQLKGDAIGSVGQPDPIAVLGDVASAIARRGMESAAIMQLERQAQERASERSVAAKQGVPSPKLTGQRFRIDVSVNDGDPVECVGGALWSCMDLARELGLGPEDIEEPLAQALAVLGPDPLDEHLAEMPLDWRRAPPPKLEVVRHGRWQPLKLDMANWYAMGQVDGIVYLLRTNGTRQEAALVGSAVLAPCVFGSAIAEYPFNPTTGELPRHGRWEPCVVEREGPPLKQLAEGAAAVADAAKETGK